MQWFSEEHVIWNFQLKAKRKASPGEACRKRVRPVTGRPEVGSRAWTVTAWEKEPKGKVGASGVQAGASELHRRRADVTPGQERGMPGKIGGISAGPENKGRQRRLYLNFSHR